MEVKEIGSPGRQDRAGDEADAQSIHRNMQDVGCSKASLCSWFSLPLWSSLCTFSISEAFTRPFSLV